MNIALLGYGRMGKAIEKIAVDRKHTIVARVNRPEEFTLENADVAIDFSIPEVAVSHLEKCFKAQVPVICGTTGWLDKFEEMAALCKKKESAFLYASNFSVGVNLFFEFNKKLAEVMAPRNEYQATLTEIHHTKKLDAPSGTAITLAEGIIENTTYTNWKLEEENKGNSNETLVITSERTGDVPGTHIINYKSNVDTITIQHEAHSRQGFALGAIIAAEWIKGKKGIFSMKDVLDL
ncbi:4-hydroxy-tetrahydrodipicolinate reductase [Dokdonia sp. Hel_I_53]|uniref:4-hydroxy-tetrahydrodipicolinate reductase n=1 Tax=Dokdonia sp. Hel_I_53 TaxID=1566287 RepID=UPI0011995CC4|nr:4-hydroxy-tetrahydrodipicolinate reductase [Dokdonia sp. Hel_I_53]TVZ53235.1 dihydrodipicolinate reductase [Dokdonia sp. Hel_I_53]